MRYLIVNGDDFGRSLEVNAGIIRAHRDGILTSASLMVTGAAALDAAAKSARFPELDVGLHVVFCNGSSALPPRRLRGLVDASRQFPLNEVSAGLRYLIDPRIRGAMRDECRAQIELHLELVGRLSHIDGHHNLHLHPVLLNILIDLARAYSIPCIRLVREPLLPSLSLAPDRMAKKIVESVFFKALSARARRLMTRAGIIGNDWLFGFHQSGCLSERYIEGAIAALPEGRVTEFYFHPAQAFENNQTVARPNQLMETQWLTHPALRAAIEAHGVKLTTYAEVSRRVITP